MSKGCKHDVLTRDGVCFVCKEKIFDYRPFYNAQTEKHVGYIKEERVAKVFGKPS